MKGRSQRLLEMAASPHANVRLWVATRSDCPVEALSVLANDSDEDVLLAVVAHQSSTAELLVQMADTLKNEWVLESFLNREDCPAEVVAKLSGHVTWNVYAKALGHPNCPPEAVEAAAHSNSQATYSPFRALDWTRTQCALRNPNCPESVLMEFSERFLLHVLRNPNCPESLFVEKSKDWNPIVRELIAGRPSCPVKVLQSLSKDPEYGVRLAVVQNPSCTEDLLFALAEDEAQSIRNLALSRLS